MRTKIVRNLNSRTKSIFMNFCADCAKSCKNRAVFKYLIYSAINNEK